MPRQLDFADGFESSLQPTSPGSSVSIANNQVAAADVTGLLFTTAVRHVWVLVSAYRRTDSNEKATLGILHIQYKTDGTTWSIEPESNFDTFVGAGLTFSIVAGQVKYVSSNLAGANYASELQFNVLQQFAA